MFCGRLKTPDPIIEPMTTAVSAPRPSFLDDVLCVEATWSPIAVLVIFDRPNPGPSLREANPNCGANFDGWPLACFDRGQLKSN
jgi:hypothetical protein